MFQLTWKVIFVATSDYIKLSSKINAFLNLDIIKWNGDHRSGSNCTYYIQIRAKTEYVLSDFTSTMGGKKILGPRLPPPINSAASRTSISRHSSNLCSFYSPTILFDPSWRAHSLSAFPDWSINTNTNPSFFGIPVHIHHRQGLQESCTSVPAEAILLWSITTASLGPPWRRSKVKRLTDRPT